MPGALSIASVGMTTPLGLNAAASCAAIRARLARFEEIAFHDQLGNPVIASAAPEAAEGQQGYRRIVPLLSRALEDCLAGNKHGYGELDTRGLPLLLALGEPTRPDLPAELPQWIFDELGRRGRHFHPSSRVFREGGIGFFRALACARELLGQRAVRACVVACADSFVNAKALTWMEDRESLKTELESDGVIPGEAAAAFLVTLPNSAIGVRAEVAGIGFGEEASALTADRANTGEGLAQAMKAALSDSNMPLEEVDFRVGDMAGERAFFREATFALARVQRVHKDRFELWLPAEKLGDVGAALPGCMLAVAEAGMRKGYAPGLSAILWASSAGAARAASIVRRPAHGL